MEKPEQNAPVCITARIFFTFQDIKISKLLWISCEMLHIWWEFYQIVVFINEVI